MNSYRIKYRGYWGNTVGYAVVEAQSEEAAKAKVSRWGFVLECLECEKVLEIKESDLANNPPNQHDLEHGTVPQGSHGYEEQEKHKEGGVS
mgnify:CR=1 FL=1